MKRFITVIALIFLSAAVYSQIPYKIQNRYVNQVWAGDTARTYIYNANHADTDSIWYGGDLPAFFGWDSAYWPEFATGAGDTNILYVVGATGRVRSLLPSQIVGAVGNSFWKLLGNSGTDSSVNFIGTTDPEQLLFRVNNKIAGKIDWSADAGFQNTYLGYLAGATDTSGGSNTFIGYMAGNMNWKGLCNTYIGTKAGEDGYGSSQSTKIGYLSGRTLIGDSNITIGYTAGYDALYGSNLIFLGNGPDSTLIPFFVNHNVGKKKMLLNDTVFVHGLHVNNSYHFPVIDGNASDVLTTDGSGNVTWQPAAGGGVSYWDSTAGCIHPNSTSATVSIGGTSSDGHTLIVKGSKSVLFGNDTTDYAANGKAWFNINGKSGACRIGDGSSTTWDYAAIGVSSFATGYGTKASAAYAIAMGDRSYATGTYSVAIGSNNLAYGGTGSLALGYASYADGVTACAIGYSTRSSGYRSFSANDQTTASSYDMAAFGRFNVAGGTADSWQADEQLFVLGNGTSGHLNNAATFYKNGKTELGDVDASTDPIMTIDPADSTTTLIGCMKLVPQADPPSTPAEGMIYSDTDHHLYYYDGSNWKQLD